MTSGSTEFCRDCNRPIHKQTMIESPGSPSPRPSALFCLILVGIASISCASIFIRLADAPALSIAAYRVTLATLILAPFYARGRKPGSIEWNRKVFFTTVLSGIFLALHFSLWIYSLQMTSVASAATLCNSTPLFAALFSVLWLKETLSHRLKLGILFTLAGSVFVAGTDFSLSTRAVWGDLLAVGGAVMAAGYFISGRIARCSLRLPAYTVVSYGTAALLLIPACTLIGAELSGFSERTYLFLVLLAVVPQVVGHTTFNWALKFIPPTTVSVLILGEPIGATILAYFVFDETVSLRKGVGLLILAAGILLSAGTVPGNGGSGRTDAKGSEDGFEGPALCDSVQVDSRTEKR